VTMSVIWMQPSYPSNYRGNKPIHRYAVGTLQAFKEKNGDVGIRTQEWDRALRYASASREISWFGRIFDKDILDNLTWTSEVRMICVW
jgi:hypothetical protein